MEGGGEAEAHNHTEAAYSLYSSWLSAAVGCYFFHFSPRVPQFVVSAVRDVAAQTRSSSQPLNAGFFDSLFLFFKSIFMRLQLTRPRTEC